MRDSFVYDYEPNLADVMAGISLGAWGSPSRVARTLFAVFVPTAALAGVMISVVMPQWSLAKTLLGALLFAIVLGVPFMLAFRAWLARYVLKRQLLDGAHQRVTVSTSGVEHQAGGVTNNLAWSAVSTIRELDRLFLLVAGKRPVGAIEKSAVSSAAELGELRAYLQTLKPFEPLP
jgi:hypothetical protein